MLAHEERTISDEKYTGTREFGIYRKTNGEEIGKVKQIMDELNKNFTNATKQMQTDITSL